MGQRSLLESDGNGGGPPATYACPQAVDAAIAAFERVKRIDNTVPLSTIWGEVPSRDIAERIDPLIDVWASNVYRFNAFGNPPNQIIDQYRALTNKPFFIGEYGCDAWNTNIGRVDEAGQAECNTRLTQILVDNSTINGGGTFGGMLFEWNDEWWKVGAGNANAHDSTPGGAPGAGPAPDGRFNEEYWGIVTLDRQPRQTYFDLCRVQNPMPNSNPDACPEPGQDPMGGLCDPAPRGDRLVIEVDLRAFPAPIQQVRLIGSFWGWNPNDGPIGLDPDGDGIYTVTFNDVPGVEFSYKWRINGQTEDLTGAGGLRW